jgi:hypothetical protein
MPAQAQNAPVSPAVIERQVEKILRSGEFSGSEVLRNLLAFLARHSIERPSESLKEYELGVAVLGKTEGFDPRLDSAVRVHAARLRSKLAEYYMTDGAADPVVIEVPKGSYQVAWRYRGGELLAPPSAPESPAVAVAPAVSRWKWFAAGAAFTLLVISAAGAIWIAKRPPRLAPQVEAFWQPFLTSPEPPLIVFSNHRFAGSSITGLRSFQEGVDQPSERNDTYSGTGTVMAVAQLTNLLSATGRAPRLKRAELLTWDEAKAANVVFVGAPDANSRLHDLAFLRHFRFKSGHEEPRFGTGGIVNLDPAAGEEPIYFGSTLPYTFDYAVVAVLPNLDPRRKVLIAAGTNTYGCQAAAEFLTRPDLLADLWKRLGVPPRAALPDFEALLRVNVRGGVPLQAELVLVKPHGQAAASH